MTLKQFQNSLQTPDGGYYVTLTDGAGNLAPASGGTVTAITEAQANAASQTWTEGTDNPLSVDLSGNLRVIDKNSAAALTALTAATPAGTNLIGKVGIDQTTNGTTNNVTTDGVADAVVSSASVSSAAVGATFSTAGYGSMSFQVIANASSNTVTVEGSNDGGTTWTSISGRSATATSTAGASGATVVSVGVTFIPSIIMPQMRWRCSAFVSGTTTVATGMKRGQSPNVVEAYVGNTIASALTSSSTSGGISTTGRLASAANSTNGTSLATGAHRIYNIQALNVAAAPRYLVLYDTASAPTVGTTTIRKKIPIPANSAIAIDFVVGLSFASGIAYALTVNAADADATAVTAGDILQLNIDYV